MHAFDAKPGKNGSRITDMMVVTGLSASLFLLALAGLAA